VRLAAEDDGEILPVTKRPIEPGDMYTGVPRLMRLLSLLGDLPAGSTLVSGETLYQGIIVEGVRNFQKRHGLNADGQIGARTLAELNVPLSRRVRQMQLTLERWRWMPSEYQLSPIVVNIPEFRLRAYDDHFKIGITMNVVVGKAYGHDTPAFIGEMHHMIFRPHWDVPLSIAEEEILPAIERDPEYMAKEDLEFVDSHGNAVGTGTITPEILTQVRERRIFIRQKPGPKNSLGLIKFIFPNRFGVYMHDTPSTELFSESRRDFSHGCIRLERPAELAAWILRGNEVWTIERIHAAMNGDETVQVNLAHPIPVLIVYGTVVVSEDGVVHFYDDIYGHDMALDRALNKGYPYPR
jgi:murein L,D-transpeptidase YcbB/YkuD